jgi:F0F1-type ATP synthase membrane subunit b/b'
VAILLPYRQRVQRSGLPQQTQQLRGDAEAALAQVGQGVADLGRGANDLREQLRKEQDESALMGADGQLANDTRALTYGDGQQARDAAGNMIPSGALMDQLGIDAIRNQDTYIQSFDAAGQRIMEGLSTDSQRAAFSRLLQARRQDFLDTVTLHVAKQSDVLYKQNLKVTLDAARSDAVGFAQRGELAKIQKPLAKALAAVEMDGARDGLEPPAIERARRVQATEIHLSVLDAMIERGFTPDARRYLEANRGQMDEAMLADSPVSAKLGAATRLEEMSNLEEHAMKHGKDAAGALAWLDQRNATLVKHGEPEIAIDILDGARDRIHQREARRVQMEHEADRQHLGSLEQELLTTGTFRYKNNPKSPFWNLSRAGRGDALRMLEAQKARQRSDRTQASNDKLFRAYYGSLELAGNDPTKEYAVSVNVQDLARRFNASTTEMYNVLGSQVEDKKKVAKDGGVSADDFRANLEVWLADENSGLSDEDIPKARQLMWQRFRNYNPDKPGYPVPQEVLDAWKIEFFRTIPTAWYLPDSTGAELMVEQGGTGEVPAGVSTTVEAPLGGQVVLVAPNGDETPPGPDGPAVDQFLADNPGWRRK